MNIDFEELAIKFNKYLISRTRLLDHSHAAKLLEGADDHFSSLRFIPESEVPAVSLHFRNYAQLARATR